LTFGPDVPAHWLIRTQVESCAYESELRLLRAAAPRAPAEALVDASLLWRDLRGLVDEGRLSYPYSTRELVKVAKHLDAYPGDGLAAACADVFAFDGFDARLAALLATVLEGHGVDADEALGGGQSYGDMTLKLPEGFKTIVGELDDNLLVDGVAGERGVYRRRVAPDGADDDDDADRPAPTSKHGETRDPIRLRFVFDCSGSMYTFNRIDRRLERLQQIALFVFEALDGLDDDYDYSVVAHSGNGPEAELFVPWGAGGKPKTPKERWAVCQRMAAHAQYCSPGDHTRVPVSAILWNTIAVPF